MLILSMRRTGCYNRQIYKHTTLPAWIMLIVNFEKLRFIDSQYLSSMAKHSFCLASIARQQSLDRRIPQSNIACVCKHVFFRKYFSPETSFDYLFHNSDITYLTRLKTNCSFRDQFWILNANAL